VAGGRAETLFSREAVIAIQEYSDGIPRTISVICDNSLVNGFAVGLKPIGRDIVLEVCRDFHIRGSRQSATRPPAPSRVPSATDTNPSSSDAGDSGAEAPAEEPLMFQKTKARRFSFF
jgi:hypothetical protein